MLGERFKYDAKPQIKLNPLQGKIKSQIESKMANGHYRLEKVACAVCGGKNFEPLSEKDRFGLPLAVVICRECGLIQVNPRLDQASLNEFYRTEFCSLAFAREKANAELFSDQYFHGQKIFRLLKKYFPAPPQEMFVLEIGCSAGGVIAYFRDQGCAVAGMDPDEDSVHFGRNCYNLDLRSTALEASKFERCPDIIIMSHVLEHLLDPNRELSIVGSLINTRGIVYIKVPGIHNVFLNFYDLDFLHYLQITHTYFLSRTTLENLLGKNGFEMAFINNRIDCVGRAAHKQTHYQNDYFKAYGFLRRLEVLRKYALVTPFKLRFFAGSVYCWLLKKTGLYGLARGVYRKIIGRREPKE